MKHGFSSKALRVRDPRAAQAMCNPFQRHLTLSLIGRDASVSELVAESGRPMSMVHYHIRRLTDLGLLKTEISTPRRGRSIKRYTAVADSVFVPTSLMRETATALLDRQLRSQLDHAEGQIEGMLFYRGDHGGMRMRNLPSERKNSRVPADSWHIVDLNEQAAAKLAGDLNALLLKAQEGSSRAAKRKHLVRFAVVRRDEDELFVT